MRDFGPIVGESLHIVSHVGEDSAYGSGIASQFIGNDPPWFGALAAQQSSKESLCGSLITMSLDQNVNDVTTRITGDVTVTSLTFWSSDIVISLPAQRFFRRLLRGQGAEPLRIITNKLKAIPLPYADLPQRGSQCGAIRQQSGRSLASADPSEETANAPIQILWSCAAVSLVHGAVQNLFRVGRHLIDI